MRSRYVTTDGIVLRRRPRPNGDALVTLLSPAGKWRALARTGKSGSGNAGRLSLFNDVSVQYYRRTEGDLPVITQVTLNGMLPRLSEPDLYPLAHFLAELCDALTVDVDYGEPLYDYLTSGLRGLCLHEDPEKVAIAYAWGMLRVAGLAPDPGGCGSCSGTAPISNLDIPAGLFTCGDCARGRRLDAVTLVELTALVSGRLRSSLTLPLAHRQEHWQLLNRYLDHHVTRLRSSEDFGSGALAGNA